MPWDSRPLEHANRAFVQGWSFELGELDAIVNKAVEDAVQCSLNELPPTLQFAFWSTEKDGHGGGAADIADLDIGLPCFADERQDKQPIFRISFREIMGDWLRRYTEDGGWSYTDKADLERMRGMLAEQISRIDAAIAQAKS